MIRIVEDKDLDAFRTELADLRSRCSALSEALRLHDGRLTQLEEQGPPDPPPPPGGGEVFNVGPGSRYETLSRLPWPLPDYSKVFLHAKEKPYREKLLLDRPVHLVGVPSRDGVKPHISGEHAIAARNGYLNEHHERRGVVTISPSKGYKWGYKPHHVTIEGIGVSNGYRENFFTNSAGIPERYADNSAGIFIERGEDITISGCVVYDNGNGVFAASGGDEATTSRRIVLQGSTFTNNGTLSPYGEDRHHHTYIEAARVTYEDCLFQSVRAGSAGAMLKDRSSGTWIGKCVFSGSAARMCDLVDREDGALIAAEDGYDRVRMVGCSFEMPSNTRSQLIHFGGDTGVFSNYKRGLNIEDCSFRIISDRELAWRKVLVRCATNDQRIKMRRVSIDQVLADRADNRSYLSLLSTHGVMAFYEDATSTIRGPWSTHRDGVEPDPGSEVIGMKYLVGVD